jgi:uncharacterized protein (DUF58 family)
MDPRTHAAHGRDATGPASGEPEGGAPGTAGLSPQLLERASELVAVAKRLVLGAGTGVHRSRRLGGGSEFSEHHEYHPGDEIRHLDWKVLARTDRYVVKRFESERRTDVQIVLDRSGSMGFGSTAGRAATAWGPWPASKWEAARTLAMSLAFVFLQQGDRVALTVVDGAREPRRSLPARGGEAWLLELARHSLARDPVGAAPLAPALEAILARSGRSLLVLVSDLLSDEEERWPRLLAVHGARGGEVWALHVVDPAERDFPYQEPALFTDLEQDAQLSVNPRDLARSYREEFARFLERSRAACLDARVSYLRVDTGEPLSVALAGFLRA